MRKDSAVEGASPPEIRPAPAAVVQTARVLKLPKEIQITILSFLVVREKQPIVLRSAKARRWRNEVRNLAAPDLGVRGWDFERDHHQRYDDLPAFRKSPLLKVLLVCKDFYYAGIEAFYGGNTLHFESLEHLQQLAAKLDKDRKRCIRHIDLWVLDGPTSRWTQFHNWSRYLHGD